MKLLTQPDSFSCALYAFAMALDVDPEWLVHQIGHDGSEQLKPTHKQRGFHYQEMIEVCLGVGRTVTPIELVASSRIPTLSGDYDRGVILEIKFKEGNHQRFMRHLKSGSGVMEGVGKNYCHWVAWNGERIFDPRGQCYAIVDCEKQHFRPHTFYLISKIN